MKQQIQLVQVNYCYGENAFLPYSAGMLQAYAQSHEDVREAYEFLPIVFLREPVEQVVARLERVDVLALSCYIWNWEYSKALGRAIKEKFPDCLVVMGGTQIPHQHKGFADVHPWADVLVFNEGEKVFTEVLRKRQTLEEVKGVILLRDGKEIVNPPAERIQDVDALPSPYLVGVFDRILKDYPHLAFQGSQETHRGCPYSCTFCDWGSATMSKVRQFNEERIYSEFKWFASSGIELLYNCDANFGLFKRDVDLIQRLVETKKESGMPSKFRAAYAKNSNQRVFEIAKLLNDEGMCKGVTLSFQSLDSNTLDAVKRKNMDVNDFKTLMDSYHEASIPTYTELILGLPGETYDSFCDGIDALLTAGQHEGLNVYHAMLLPNSEMSKPAYKELHKIESVKTELLLLHGTREKGDLPEYYDIVVATSSMNREMWVKAALFAYVVQAFHCLNLTGIVAEEAVRSRGQTYRGFYEGLIAHLKSVGGVAGDAIRGIEQMLIEVSEGRRVSLDMGDRTFGDVMWPVEEILFLQLLKQRGKWRGDVLDYMSQLGFTRDWYVNQLISTKWPSHIGPECDWETFAREVVWYGRKGGTMRRTKADRCQVLTKSKPLISILIPSRGRVAMLKRCVESIKAVTPQDDYEILIRADEDDGETLRALEELEKEHPNLRGVIGKCLFDGPKRGFTPVVNHYYTELAGMAKAPWIWIMNDDCTIEGDGWIDDLRGVPLEGYLVEPGIYKLNVSSYVGCPAFPIMANQSWLKLGATEIMHPADTAMIKLYTIDNDWQVELLSGLTVWHDWKEPVSK